jgi:hypothetical protein
MGQFVVAHPVGDHRHISDSIAPNSAMVAAKQFGTSSAGTEPGLRQAAGDQREPMVSTGRLKDITTVAR